MVLSYDLKRERRFNSHTVRLPPGSNRLTPTPVPGGPTAAAHISSKLQTFAFRLHAIASRTLCTCVKGPTFPAS